MEIGGQFLLTETFWEASYIVVPPDGRAAVCGAAAVRKLRKGEGRGGGRAGEGQGLVAGGEAGGVMTVVVGKGGGVLFVWSAVLACCCGYHMATTSPHLAIPTQK